MGDENSDFAPISSLRREENEPEAQDKTEIAATLLSSFFPPLPDYPTPQRKSRGSPITVPPLTKEEVSDAIFSANVFSAGGVDNFPSIIWQKLWPVLNHQIFELFQSSLSQGKLPDQWKIAKIIPLRKPDQSSYTLPGAYRPISLLSTLGKAMESVIASRIGYLADKYSLLRPGNHFGGQKGKSTVAALFTLQEKIYQVWRDKKVLSLVIFDVKGAFNGVAPDVLINRLRTCHIPEHLVCWIEDFMQNRKASVVLNGVTSSVSDLAHTGLPQGSPLSPILYLFFNSELARSVINKNKGAIAFIDDYTALVTGPSIVVNVESLQEKIVPHLENWAFSSGATFQAKKTCMVHFTRNKRRTREAQADILLVIGDQKIICFSRS